MKLCVMLLVFLATTAITVVVADAPSSSSSSSSRAAQNSLSAKPHTPHPPPPPPPLYHHHPPTTDVLRVVETEVYDPHLQQWIGETSRGRWALLLLDETNQRQRPCDSPAALRAPRGGTFVGDWKIVLGEDRDAYGWNYSYYDSTTTTTTTTSASTTATTATSRQRQRIWLRTYTTVGMEPPDQDVTTTVEKTEPKVIASQNRQSIIIPTPPLSTATTTTTVKPRPLATPRKTLPRPSSLWSRSNKRYPTFSTAASSSTTSSSSTTQNAKQLLNNLLQTIQDDWNFKGFGWSFYKSCLSKSSIGMAFRIPLTSNWDVWDRHPEWPSVSLSLGFYYPFCVGLYVSASVNLAWVKWATTQVCIVVRHWIATLFVTLARGFWIAATALAYPLTHQWYMPEQFDTLLPSLAMTLHQRPPKPNFQSTAQERIGITHSWRLYYGAEQKSGGFEFVVRRSIWHMYLPTLLSLVAWIDPWYQSLQQALWWYWVKWQTFQHHHNSRTTASLLSLLGTTHKHKHHHHHHHHHNKLHHHKKKKKKRSASNNTEEPELEQDDNPDHHHNSQHHHHKPLPTTTPPTPPTPSSLLEKAQNSKWADWWLQRKTGSLGISTGYPSTEKPYFTCSALLSLSGFYFFQKPQQTAAATLATSPSSSTTTAIGSSGNSILDNQYTAKNPMDDNTAGAVATAVALQRTLTATKGSNNMDNNDKSQKDDNDAALLASTLTSTKNGASAATSSSTKKTTTNA